MVPIYLSMPNGVRDNVLSLNNNKNVDGFSKTADMRAVHVSWTKTMMKFHISYGKYTT